MGLFTGLLLPCKRGDEIWRASTEQLAKIAEDELHGEQTIRRLLVEAELELEAGRLSAEEYEQVEDELLERLAQIREAQP